MQGTIVVMNVLKGGGGSYLNCKVFSLQTLERFYLILKNISFIKGMARRLHLFISLEKHSVILFHRTSLHLCSLCVTSWVQKMAQQLGALTAPVEDLSSVPSAHIR